MSMRDDVERIINDQLQLTDSGMRIGLQGGQGSLSAEQAKGYLKIQGLASGILLLIDDLDRQLGVLDEVRS